MTEANTIDVVIIHEHLCQDGETLHEPTDKHTPVALEPAEARLAIHVGHAVLAEEREAPAPADEQPADVQKPSISSKPTQPPTIEVDKTKEQGR